MYVFICVLLCVHVCVCLFVYMRETMCVGLGVLASVYVIVCACESL